MPVYILLPDRNKTGQPQRAAPSVNDLLLYVHGKFDELVGQFGFLQNFFCDVLTCLDDNDAIVHLDRAGSFFAKQEPTMALLGCFISCGLLSRVGSWSCFGCFRLRCFFFGLGFWCFVRRFSLNGFSLGRLCLPLALPPLWARL